MKKCHFCGRPISTKAYVGFGECDGIQKYVADPFMMEIHDEIEMKWLCEGQYEEIAWEI